MKESEKEEEERLKGEGDEEGKRERKSRMSFQYLSWFVVKELYQTHLRGTVSEHGNATPLIQQRRNNRTWNNFGLKRRLITAVIMQPHFSALNALTQSPTDQVSSSSPLRYWHCRIAPDIKTMCSIDAPVCVCVCVWCVCGQRFAASKTE